MIWLGVCLFSVQGPLICPVPLLLLNKINISDISVLFCYSVTSWICITPSWNLEQKEKQLFLFFWIFQDPKHISLHHFLKLQLKHITFIGNYYNYSNYYSNNRHTLILWFSYEYFSICMFKGCKGENCNNSPNRKIGVHL